MNNEVHTTGSSRFKLRKREMVEIGDSYPYRASRLRIAKIFTTNLGLGVHVKFSVDKGPADDLAFAKSFSDGSLTIGCQRFRPEEAEKIRTWALKKVAR